MGNFSEIKTRNDFADFLRIPRNKLTHILYVKKPDSYYKTFRFLYKGIIIKHNKTEPTYTKTSLFLCEKRRFFMGRTEKGGKVF